MLPNAEATASPMPSAARAAFADVRLPTRCRWRSRVRNRPSISRRLAEIAEEYPDRRNMSGIVSVRLWNETLSNEQWFHPTTLSQKDMGAADAFVDYAHDTGRARGGGNGRPATMTMRASADWFRKKRSGEPMAFSLPAPHNACSRQQGSLAYFPHRNEPFAGAEIGWQGSEPNGGLTRLMGTGIVGATHVASFSIYRGLLRSGAWPGILPGRT
jgi:hypothetical protein